MCKKIRPSDDIHIKVGNHRDLVLRVIENQFIPADPEEARKKSYVRAVTLKDLTNGIITTGAIAFTTNHAIIFTEEHPQGLARETFVDRLPVEHQELANRALNTFLRLHAVFNSALDACRPYPSKVVYGTDDEIEKIQAGRMQYRDLATDYNTHQRSHINFVRHTPGKSGGFVDPSLNGKNVSYHAINPLVFFQP